MSKFSEMVLQALDRDYGVNPETIASGLADAIQGKTVRTVYSAKTNPQTGVSEMHLSSRTETCKPADVLKGAIMYDALTGGELGITKQTRRMVSDVDNMYGDFKPQLPDGARVTDIIARPGEDLGEGKFVHPESDD